MLKRSVPNWSTKNIDELWDELVGASVLDTPDHLGHDLVVWAHGLHGLVNLGPINSAALCPDDSYGRGFLVRTNRFGKRGELFVQLADGVKVNARYEIEV